MIYYKIADKMQKDARFTFLIDKILDFHQSKSFLHETYKDIHAWKEGARRLIKDRLSYSPAAVPFNEEMVEEVDFGEYTRQKIYFSSAPGCRIPAYVLVPKGLKAPAPGVVVLHDHAGQFYWGKEKSVEHKEYTPTLKKHIDDNYQGHPTASALARRGYVAVVIDSVFFGERKYDLFHNEEFREMLGAYEGDDLAYVREYNRIQLLLEYELTKIVLYAGHTVMGIRTWDDVATVGYLAGRPEVDAGRIGCIGLSMGGHRAAWLSAMDDRIRCAVVACWLGRPGEMVMHVPYGTPLMWAVPGLYGHLDFPDIVSLSAPKPLLTIHGTEDRLFNHKTNGDDMTSADRASEVIRGVYNKAGYARNYVHEVFDGPHEFNLSMQEKAYSWLDQCFGTRSPGFPNA